MEKGDDSEKDLYGIRGLNDTECDAPVPASWMKCPPIKLDLPIPDMEALRVGIMLLRSTLIECLTVGSFNIQTCFAIPAK